MHVHTQGTPPPVHQAVGCTVISRIARGWDERHAPTPQVGDEPADGRRHADERRHEEEPATRTTLRVGAGAAPFVCVCHARPRFVALMGHIR